MTPRKRPAKRELKGWVIVYADDLIDLLLWPTRTEAKHWLYGRAGTVTRATLRLAPPKRRKKP